MKKIGNYLQIRNGRGLALVMCLGLLGSVSLREGIAKQTPQAANQTQSHDLATLPSPVQGETTFKAEGPLGHGVMFDDTGKPLMVKNMNGKYVEVVGGTTWWRASDGEKVFTHSWNLVSLEFVSRYLKEKLLDAQVLKRDPRRNEKGETIGERIVALFSVPIDPHRRGPNDPHRSVSAVIRTNGTYYSEITSDSMDDVLAFEKSPNNNWH